MKIELPKRTPEDFRFSCPIDVRFRDIDAMGHVNNAVYATYFENARAGYIEALDLELGEGGELTERFPFIVVDLYCRFLSAVKIDENLNAYIRCDLGRSSFVFQYLLTSAKDERHVAIGETTQVSFSYARNRTTRISQEFREAVERLEDV